MSARDEPARDPQKELAKDARDEPARHGERVILPEEAFRRLREEAEEAYPREACGVLLGRVQEGARVIQRAVPAPNRWSERADRYLVDPGTLRRLLDREAEGGPRILGFYHSHPDAGSVPSPTDEEHAWPWYVYLILTVGKGSAGEARAWRLERETGRFRELDLVPAEHTGSRTPNETESD